MRRWFLSYNSQDLGLMQSLETALRRKDPDAKIFFAPRSLRAGGLWLPEVAREIAEATAFVLLVGAKGVSPWQAMEYYEALDRRVNQQAFVLVVVLLDGQAAPGLPFLRQLHWVIAADPGSDNTVAQVIEAACGGGAAPEELWRRTAPYRGLAAMTESDSDYFFGRAHETVDVIGALATPEKLPVLIGNSGVGKSSLAQAGAIAALMRQAWPENAHAAGSWPAAFNTSRRWCFLKLKPSTEPVRALVEPFLWTWQFEAVDPRRAELQSSWTRMLLEGKVTLRDLLDATQARYRDELHQPEPPAFLIYVDQGEELYVRADERERRRFSEIVSQGLADQRLHAMMSLRADFFGDLQRDEPLYAVHRQINVPPLREPELREVVSRPAALLSARFEPEELAADIAQRTAQESVKDAGALPLVSYLLDDMWTSMIRRGDARMRLPKAALDIGAVLVDRANAFMAAHQYAEEKLKRIFSLRLATVRENEEPTRRRALRTEFSDDEWRLVGELADHPNRLLIAATSESGETYAEVAHEAIFRRWDKLRQWIAAEREFLAWRSGLEAARRVWQATPGNSKGDALLMGLALTQAQNWLSKRSEDLPAADRDFIVLSRKAMQRRRSRVQALVGMLAAAMIAVLGAWRYERQLREGTYWLIHVRGQVLTADRERSLRPKEIFKECVNCPEMVVVPAGEFMMGSPSNEVGRVSNEGPVHKVTIANPFAVGKFELTFDEWDACAAHGDCDSHISAGGWGRGRQPVINVSWYDAIGYVAWLSRITGQPYRLLTEAEWEYAARAGATTRYSFGDDVAALGKYAWSNANSGGKPHPVGEKEPNAFGLYDMHGNVWEWVQDCYEGNYNQAPANGSANMIEGCEIRPLRGGSWAHPPLNLRATKRNWSFGAAFRDYGLGFRVGRTLTP